MASLIALEVFMSEIIVNLLTMSIFYKPIPLNLEAMVILSFLTGTAIDGSRLEALRSAVRVGIDDFEQGRYATFESGSQLRSHLASLASKAITGE